MIGFRLHESKYPMVTNAAIAIIRQLIIWLFEQVSDEDNREDACDGVVSKTYASDAFTIFQDICLLTNDERPIVLGLDSIDKSFSLELVESVLAYHSRIFRNHPEYVTILKEKICTLAVRSFTEGSSFPQACRLWRVVDILLCEFHDLLSLESEIFISFLPRILEDDKAEWEKILVLEMAKSIFAKHELMLDLYAICDRREEGEDQGPHVFQDLVFSVANQISTVTSSVDEDTVVIWESGDMKVTFLSQFDKAQAPPTPPFYRLHLAFDAISNWINGIHNALTSDSIDEHHRNVNLECKILLQKSWLQIIRSFMSILTIKVDPEWVRNVFLVLDRLGFLLGYFEMSDALKVLFEDLFKLDSQLNVPSWQTVLDVAMHHPDAVKGAWPVVVKVLHSVDIFSNIIKSRKINNGPATASNSPPESLMKKLSSGQLTVHQTTSQAELGSTTQLSEAIKRLIDGSFGFSEETFLLLFRALAESAQTTSSANDFYLIHRLRQVSLANMSRFLVTQESPAWDCLEERLQQLMASEEVAFRSQGCEVMSQVVLAYSAAADKIIFKKESILQIRLIRMLHQKVSIKYVDVQKVVMELAGRLIQELGPHFNPEGWLLLFMFLNDAITALEEQERVTKLSLIRSGFYCAKLVSSDFLACLNDECFFTMQQLLGRFAEQKEDINICLTAVGLLLDISDFLRKARNEKGSLLENVFKIWLEVLSLVSELSVEARPEIRHSAIGTLIQTMEKFVPTLATGEWDPLFEQIILPLFRKVQLAADTIGSGGINEMTSKGLIHYTRNSVEKQWDETQVLLLTGISKIYSEFSPVISRLARFEVYWDYLLKVIEGHCRPSKSIELVSVSVACFQKLCSNQANAGHVSTKIWNRTWKAWEQISEWMKDSPSFTQETLQTFVEIFGESLYPALSKAKAGDLKWLVDSLTVIDRVLQCPSPADVIKDIDQPTDLQKACLAQVNFVDYLRWGLDGQVALLRQLSRWMNLVGELKQLEMTRNNSVRRHRKSTPASRPRTPVIDFPSGIHPKGVATFIGLSQVILGEFTNRFACWHPTRGFYNEAFNLIIRSIGRVMVLKYRAPSSSTSEEASWKVATRAFNTIFASTPKASLDEPCWEGIVEILSKSLEASRRMVPVALEVEQLAIDEEFDIEHQVNFIKNIVLPAMGSSVPEAVLRELLLALEKSSQLYYQKSESPTLAPCSGIESPPAVVPRGGTPSMQVQSKATMGNHNEPIPVIKEKFAIACLKALFEVSSVESALADKSIVRIALGILLHRVRHVLEQYIEDGKLLGNMPFPRVRQDEMIFCLRSLISLRIHPGLGSRLFGYTDLSLSGIVAPITEPTLSDSFVDPITDNPLEAHNADTATIHQSKESIVATSAVVPLDLRRYLLDTQIGHLFALYPSLYVILSSKDPKILDLTRQAFALIGREAGLMP